MSQTQQTATPKTDALADDLRADGWNTEHTPLAAVLAKARSLERDNARLAEELEQLKTANSRLGIIANDQCDKMLLSATNAQLQADCEAWRLAALQCGLYRSDSDVSTPEKWKSAQIQAALKLIDRADDCERMRAALEALVDECRVHCTAPPDYAWSECICGKENGHEPDCKVEAARAALRDAQAKEQP